jgi:MoaA/NifB/PqqE/SkfB family radical SAM enzyme
MRRNTIRPFIREALENIGQSLFLPKELKGFPRDLHIEVSNVCNLDCEYCKLKDEMTAKFIMTPETFALLKPHLKYVRSIALSGLAEPLLNKHLVRFIREIKSESPRCLVALVTNATLLTTKLCTDLVEAGLDYIDFSIDGVDDEVVDPIRRGSSLKKVIANIRVFKQVKDAMGSPSPVMMSTLVLQAKNYRQLPQVIELAAELGCQGVNVNGLEPYDDEMARVTFMGAHNAPDDLPEILEQALRKAQQAKIELTFPSFFPLESHCDYYKKPIIMANGDVTPCAVMAYRRGSRLKVDESAQLVPVQDVTEPLIMGNIKEKSFDAIWFSDKYKQFRHAMKSGVFPATCDNCLLKHGLTCTQKTVSPHASVATLAKAMQERSGVLC